MKDSDINFLAKKRVKIALEIMWVNIAVIIVFTVAGWLVDKYFDTKHFGILIGVLISFPVTQFILYKKLVKKKK